MKLCNSFRSGQSLVELLVVIALAALFLPTLISGLFATRNGRAQQQQRLQAVAFLKEAQDGIRSVRDRDWTTFATDGTYHLIASASAWALQPGSEVLNGFGFTRSIVIDDVYRDVSGAIATSGGTLDPSTKKVTITVAWTSPISSSVSSINYFSRFSNITYSDTTVADFTAGSQNNVNITNTKGGEVALTQTLSGPSADWCKPQNNIVNGLTLPKKANSIWAQPGAAYLGTGDGSGGTTFINIGITDPTPPPGTPSASVLGTFGGSNKTNGIYSDGTYVYLATDATSPQILIVDISHTPYTQVGTITAPSGTGANGIYVANNVAYVTSANTLYTFNITTKTGAHTTPLSQINMWIGIGSTPLAKQVVVVNNHAYVGTANTLFGLQVFKVSNNGATLQLVGVSNLTWQQSSQGVYVNISGTRGYVAFDNGAGVFPKGFFIVDTSPADPPSWWLFPNFYNIVGTYNAGSTDPAGMVAIPDDNRAIIVGKGGSNNYQVIDISTESNPVFCGGLSINPQITGIASVKEADTDAYSYIITGETSNQFKIIAGGPGSAYNATGSFTSRTFDATHSSTFNNISASVLQPTNTTISMQVASAVAVNNSCTNANFTFLGPNASSAAYFQPMVSTPSAVATISALIPYGTYNPSYQNPARCFQYKMYFTSSDPTQTPILYDALINYSP